MGAKKRSKMTSQRPVVLLAEDEESFITALEIGLANEGFDVLVARDGQEALRIFEEHRVDLILLDLMLPKVSGLDVCRTIRQSSAVPIIMVTAKGTEIDTVVGLEIGADDYVTKPYRLRELVARMRAVLRRAPDDIEIGTPSEALEFGGVRLEIEQRKIFVRDTEKALRRKEFELLRILMEHAGRVVTRDSLIDQVWGSDYVGDTKTLDVHIKRLRAHVEENPSKPLLIATVRGVGYRFDGSKSS